MKTIPNLITLARIICSVNLLLTKPLSAAFWLLYILCGLSDMLDGYIARKTGQTSRFGAKLDSIADFIFIFIVLVILIPAFSWKPWMLIWLSAIALLRFITFGVGYAKYHTVAWLHTYANKVTGIALFCSPLLWQICGSELSAFVLCGIASLSAIEELLITATHSKLNSNIKTIINF